MIKIEDTINLLKTNLTELDAIYNEQIKPNFVYEGAKETAYKITLVGGTMGSSVTSYANSLFENIRGDNQSSVLIDEERLLSFVPNTDNLENLNESQSLQSIQQITNYWSNKIRKHFKDTNAHIIEKSYDPRLVKGYIFDTQPDLLRLKSRHGEKIEMPAINLHVIATNRRESELNYVLDHINKDNTICNKSVFYGDGNRHALPYLWSNELLKVERYNHVNSIKLMRNSDETIYENQLQGSRNIDENFKNTKTQWQERPTAYEVFMLEQMNSVKELSGETQSSHLENRIEMAFHKLDSEQTYVRPIHLLEAYNDAYMYYYDGLNNVSLLQNRDNTSNRNYGQNITDWKESFLKELDRQKHYDFQNVTKQFSREVSIFKKTVLESLQNQHEKFVSQQTPDAQSETINLSRSR